MTVTLDALRQKYSAVILAYGATTDRELGLAGEKTLKGVIPSRRIVEYYNGSLDMDLTPEEFDPEVNRHIGIIGNGNIACDISRMFLKDPSEFRDSDTPEHVMQKLRKSRIHTVEIIGRRGITQAAFTTKEIRELSLLQNLKTYMVKSEVEDSMTDASRTEMLERAISRRTKLLHESSEMIESAEHYEDVLSRVNEKKLILRFLRNPTELIPSENDPSRIGRVTLQRMQLEGEANKQRAISRDDGDESALRNLNCDVLVKSIGYKSVEMEGVPFDHKRSVIPHEFGCVKDPETGELDVGLYVAGWIKRGPVGIVDATLRDSIETFKMVKHHLECDIIPESEATVEDV